jgi:outer membrane receptor protein involved in Fe transport
MKYHRVAMTVVAALSLNYPAVAQPSEQKTAVALEEVLVTARKRSESQQSVPVAVTAVSAEEMAQNNIDNIAGLAKIAPGLDQREGRKQGAFAIRGVGQNRINELQADPGVAVYLDGMFLARNDTQLVDSLTIQSVQVLRGPQGTLFGKNSVGGAILVTTKDPFEEFTLTASGKVDSLGQRNVSISMDTPLSDSVFTKLIVGSIQSDGYAEDIDSGREFGDDDRLIAALQVLWEISPDARLKTLLYANKQDEQIPPYNCEFVTDTSSLSYARAPGREEAYLEACQRVEPLFSEEKVQSEDFGLRFKSEDLLLGATLDWDLGFAEFKSISSYALKGDNRTDFDIDATDLLIVRNVSYNKQLLEDQGVYDEDGSRYTIGQEFQLSGLALDNRLQYTVGIFGSKESLDKQLAGQMLTPEGWVGFERLPGLPSPNDFCAGTITGEDCLYVRGLVDSNVASYDNTSYAAFSQVIYDILDTVHLTGGLRYSYEKREIKLENFQGPLIPSGGGVITIPGDPTTGNLPITVMTETQFNQLEGDFIPISRGTPRSGEVDFERLSPMMSLSWDVAEQYQFKYIDGLLTYITVSEGFKSGGFNSLASGIGTFEPEFVISTEVGFKLDALQRSLRLNVAAYNSDYKDIQILVTKLSSLGAPEVSTNNAGLAKMRGVEFELTWLPSANWILRASGNYIDAEFLEYDDEVLDPVSAQPRPVDRSSEPFPYIPEYVYSLSARYNIDTTIGNLSLMLARNTRAGQFLGNDAAAGLPMFRDRATTDSFSIYTARASWIPFDDYSLQVSLFVNNLTDEEYVASGSATYSGFGSNSLTRGKRVHGGLELKYEWR